MGRFYNKIVILSLSKKSHIYFNKYIKKFESQGRDTKDILFAEIEYKNKKIKFLKKKDEGVLKNLTSSSKLAIIGHSVFFDDCIYNLGVFYEHQRVGVHYSVLAKFLICHLDGLKNKNNHLGLNISLIVCCAGSVKGTCLPTDSLAAKFYSIILKSEIKCCLKARSTPLHINKDGQNGTVIPEANLYFAKQFFDGKKTDGHSMRIRSKAKQASTNIYFLFSRQKDDKGGKIEVQSAYNADRFLQKIKGTYKILSEFYHVGEIESLRNKYCDKSSDIRYRLFEFSYNLNKLIRDGLNQKKNTQLPKLFDYKKQLTSLRDECEAVRRSVHLSNLYLAEDVFKAYQNQNNAETKKEYNANPCLIL